MNLAQLDEIVARSKEYCTEKEAEFLGSIREFFIRKSKLTPGQQSWAESISEKYSEEFLEEEKEWQSGWTKKHRMTATRVAKYYEANPPYYSNYVARIQENLDGFILTKREWGKFCENKYAKKVTNQYEEELKFSRGDCIQFRASNRLDLLNEGVLRTHRSNFKDKVGFILEGDAKYVTRIAKGSRVYKILLTGEVNPVFAHESDIKKRRGKK